MYEPRRNAEAPAGPSSATTAAVERISLALRELGYDAYAYALADGDDPRLFWAQPGIYTRELKGAAVAIHAIAFDGWKYPDGRVQFRDTVPHLVDHGPDGGGTRSVGRAAVRVGFRPRWCWTGPDTGTKLDNTHILSADTGEMIGYLRAALPDPSEPICRLYTSPDDHLGSAHQPPADWFEAWAESVR
jgi:hypothetical protein